jgi:hypothetical protein
MFCQAFTIIACALSCALFSALAEGAETDTTSAASKIAQCQNLLVDKDHAVVDISGLFKADYIQSLFDAVENIGPNEFQDYTGFHFYGEGAQNNGSIRDPGHKPADPSPIHDLIDLIKDFLTKNLSPAERDRYELDDVFIRAYDGFDPGQILHVDRKNYLTATVALIGPGTEVELSTGEILSTETEKLVIVSGDQREAFLKSKIRGTRHRAPRFKKGKRLVVVVHFRKK